MKRNKITFIPIALGIGIAIAGELWGFLNLITILIIFGVCGMLLFIPLPEEKNKNEVKMPPAIYLKKPEEPKNVLIAREVTTVVKRVRSIYGKEIS